MTDIVKAYENLQEATINMLEAVIETERQMSESGLIEELTEFCQERQCDSTDGKLMDADTIWPSEILNIIEKWKLASIKKK